MLRAVGVTSLVVLLAFTAPAAAKKEVLPTRTVKYGALTEDTAVVHPAGATPVLLLHENGQTTKATERMAFQLQEEGFTVLNLEWEEFSGKGGVWEFDVDQIEEAIEYVSSAAPELEVDPTRLAMVGGSRGANLSLLASLEVDAAAAPAAPVKVVVSLSGDANPEKQIERANKKELQKGIAGKLARVYGCTPPPTIECDPSYVKRWSPVEKASASAPAMFLAASEAEKKTASLADQYELATKLNGFGVAAEVAAPATGHGIAYWGKVRAQAIAFINANVAG